MDKKIYEELKRLAEELGFDSAQAYVRFWAKAETTNRDHDTYQNRNRSDALALRYLELLLASSETPFESVQGALNYIVKQINRTEGLKYLNKLLDYKT